ncbi:MAG TPA: UvrD-helicase domain-containing protein [Xanthobacteraceae bacterium]|nr:UvrD-helicase domain-containing protein [Xanthobacteraceae bacterium]
MAEPKPFAPAPAPAPAPASGIAARARAAAPAPYLQGLNPEQREAVETLDGPVLVLAGAGTGKTRVLTTRIAHILSQRRAFPSQILAVTFTNKAAREMKERIGHMVGQVVEGMPWLGTFHSIGARILRRHAELAGLKPDFTILDTDDQIRLLKQLIAAEGIDEKRWPARLLANMIDGWKNRGLTPDQVQPGEGAAYANGRGLPLYKAYQARLKTLNAADFGDLLIENIRIFREHPEVLRDYQQRFKFILVDEYQDTNVAQYLWLRLLAQRSAPVSPGTEHAAPAQADHARPAGGAEPGAADAAGPDANGGAAAPGADRRAAAGSDPGARAADAAGHGAGGIAARSAGSDLAHARALPPKNICCVGDDDQSIYGWRGAEVDNILRFEQDFPGAKVIRLERNYRSTGHILAAASHLIAHNEGRLGKTLRTEDVEGEKVTVTSAWDSEEEARAIGEEIEQLQRQGHVLNEIAILVRASFQMREFEDRFVTLGLPYRVIGGPRFYERAEIRDALAYLRLVNQPADDLAFERIVNVPKRGLGDATVKVLHDLARAEGVPLMEATRRIVATDELKPKPRAALRDLVEAFERWRAQRETLPQARLAEIILDESGYTEMWQKDRSADAAGRLENLKELVRSMEEFENLQGFLEHVSLVMDADGGESADAVSIMTLHGAKGLEFDTVFLPGWEEGILPNQRSLDEQGRAGLEEERRLAHVGITRARRRAKIYFVANRRIHGSWTSSIPSRFIDELPADSVEVEESKAGFGGFSGYGGHGSRFDQADSFGSSYSTPGWRRAQRRRGFEDDDDFGGAFSSDDSATRYGEAEPTRRYRDSDTRGSWKNASPSPPLGGDREGAGRSTAAGFARPQQKRIPLTIEGELIAKSTGTTSPFSVGDRVFHQKFGNGNVVHVEGNKLTIQFDKAGEKRVVDSFVERV